MPEPRRRFAHGASALLAVAIVSCGGGSPSRPTPTPTPLPTPLPPQVVAQRTGFELPAGFIGWLPFPTSRAGRLDATVDWTLSQNDLNVYLIKGQCDFAQLNAGQCEVLAASESRSAKPEVVSYDSPNASTYTIFIDNLGPGDESVSFQVVLRATLGTPGGGLSSTSAPASVLTPPTAIVTRRR